MTAITSAISRAAISCVLLLTLSHVAAADDDKAKLDNLKRAISSLEKQLGQRDKEKNTLATELKKVEVDAANISKNIRRVTQQINGHVATLQNLDVQQHDLRKNIKQQNAAISEHIAASYKLGNQESIKLLLNQEDPQKLARVFKYYSYFIDARNEKIAAYTADVEKLAVLSTEVSQQKEQLDSAKEQLLDNQQKLLAASKTRAATLQKLTVSLQNDRGKLDKLLKERRELEELLATVERAEICRCSHRRASRVSPRAKGLCAGRLMARLPTVTAASAVVQCAGKGCLLMQKWANPSLLCTTDR
jgi:septal ring factor EnvC (AmiA/AmiB activator)